MSRLKAQNDPWTPLPEKAEGILQPPCDPRYQLIDSDRYIESLERRLQRLKGRNKPEPSSRDIIDSLAGFKDDQMRRFLQNGHSVTSPPSATITTGDATASSGSASYLQRRLHPERQALNMEELFELLKDDELARNRFEEEEDEGEQKHASQTESAPLAEVCGKDSEKNVDGDCGKEIDCSSAVKEIPEVSEKSLGEQGVKNSSDQCDSETNNKQNDDTNHEHEEKDASKDAGGKDCNNEGC